MSRTRSLTQLLVVLVVHPKPTQRCEVVQPLLSSLFLIFALPLIDIFFLYPLLLVRYDRKILLASSSIPTSAPPKCSPDLELRVQRLCRPQGGRWAPPSPQQQQLVKQTGPLPASATSPMRKRLDDVPIPHLHFPDPIATAATPPNLIIQH